MLNDKYKNEEPKYAWNKSLMIYYLGSVFIYLTCLFKWKLHVKNKKKVRLKSNDVVKQTMKDYTLNRSNLIRAEKPIPKYDDDINESSPVELDYVDESSSAYINNKNKENKKKLLLQINQKKKNEIENKIDE